MKIYVITAVNADSPCKVGMATNPEWRARDLSCGSPVDLIVRYRFDCTLGMPDWGSSRPYFMIRRRAREVESAIHKELNLFRIRGEWFDIDAKSASIVIEKHITKAIEVRLCA